MHEFSMSSYDGRQATFVGKLLHQDSTTLSLKDGLSREFVLQVFAVEGGGFVSFVGYESTCDSEVSVKLFEETDNLEDVEKFFFVFDAGEYIIKESKVSRSEQSEQAIILKRLAICYEDLAFKFLDDTKSQISNLGCCDRIQKEPTESGSFWNMFKLN